MEELPSDETPELTQLLLRARQSVEEIQSFKTQCEALLKQVEISRKSADSEALYAFNAKGHCEAHATAIAGIKAAVEVDVSTLSTNKQKSEEILAALTTARANIDSDTRTIEDKRKEVEQVAQKTNSAAEISAARLDEIEVSLQTAKDQAGKAAESANTAAEAEVAAHSAQSKTEKSSMDAQELLNKVSGDHQTTSKLAGDIEALLAQAQLDKDSLKQVLDHLSRSDEIATAHEQRVETLANELQSLNKRVEGLLPGATSAGLASSFKQQRSRFTEPQRQWLTIFIGCMGLLFIVSLPTFLSAIGWWGHTPDQSWNAAWRSLAFRLPILAPVVWLAIYAGRNYMMSLRMEEDYAYKEAISTAFEGYKREMEKIESADGENPTPVTILCTNILTAIAERPGRIYEGKQHDINLAAEVQSLMAKSAEFSKKKLATN